MTGTLARTAWRPALVDCLAGYRRRTLASDLAAGVTVGALALPVAMALGIASGMTPQAGIYTAILGGLVVSMLGGSRIQIAGPAGAFVVVVAGTVARFGPAGVGMLGLMTGAILVLLALTGLGNAVSFIPRPVVLGFTNGIALLLVSTQIDALLGVTIAGAPTEFFARMAGLAASLPAMNGAALGLGVASIALVIAVPRRLPWPPGSVVAVVVGVTAVAVGLPVETVGSRFGDLPIGLASIAVPQFRGDLILPLLPVALTVAVLVAAESLLSAVVADAMTGDHHHSNTELLAQAVANLLVPFVGGIPVAGAIARTATNHRFGARTPLAGIVHAVTLVILVAVLAPFIALVPLTTLAAVLWVLAYKMGEWRAMRSLWCFDWADRAACAFTLALTLMADLTLAVEVGVGLAALLFIYRAANRQRVSGALPARGRGDPTAVVADAHVPSRVSIFHIQGPLLFGTTARLTEVMADLSLLAPVVVLRLQQMRSIDATGLHALTALGQRLRRSGRTLVLCDASREPAWFLGQPEFVEQTGKRNIVPHLRDALRRAREIRSRFSGVGEDIARDLHHASL